MKLLEPGDVLDGFVVEECLRAGGMGHIYRVRYERDSGGESTGPGFAMVMKVPRMTSGDGAENIVGFEVEQQILRALTGPHVPRFVAAGDLGRVPFLVMEYVPGQTLQHLLDQPAPTDPGQLARLGAATARAVHSLHQQDVCHMDIKPANVLIRPDDSAVLLDFGLSYHAHYPDLLAEEMRKAIGSPAWMAPEQVVGVRGDPRSDIFAIGVVLYELATGELPFGAPLTAGGLRQRLWMDPPPPRSLRPDLPDWLQEVILRCLEPVAARRYPSAAHLAFDLSHPDQITVTERGRKTRATGLFAHLRRWLRATGLVYEPSPRPAQFVDEAPIVMVALPNGEVSDSTLYSLRQAASHALGALPGARLACVTVMPGASIGAVDDEESESGLHRRHLGDMRRWAGPLVLSDHQVSFHVLESSDVAHALVRYAEANHVSMLILGAATHGLQLQRFVATIPSRVAMTAPCTVILVKQFLPFERLGAAENATAAA